jgi:hypothetical protein
VLTATGTPSPDARVVFSVAGANARAPRMVPTTATGQATFVHTGPNPGHDVIQAFVDLNANNNQDIGEPQDSIGHDFTAPVPATIKLAPPSNIAAVRSGASFTAAVLDAAGAPVQGATITFLVTGANPQSGSATTDANGNAIFEYTGNNVGTDTIVAFADLDEDDVPGPNEPQARATQNFTAVPARQVIVPDLTGKTVPAATSALRLAQLRLGTVTALPDPPRPPFEEDLKPVLTAPMVVDQSPAPGTLVPTESSVDITVQKDWV